MKQETNQLTFSEHLHLILEENKNNTHISLEDLIRQLGNRDYSAIIFLISIAFSFPISIPGLSTPFGLVLALFGLWILLGKKLWLPNWLKSKSLSYTVFKKIGTKAIWLFLKLEKLMHPRLFVLSQSKLFMGINGTIILILALLLALPLPIPLTNILAAFPIVLISLGLLEKDGYLILAGYIGAFFSLSTFVVIFATISSFF